MNLISIGFAPGTLLIRHYWLVGRISKDFVSIIIFVYINLYPCFDVVKSNHWLRHGVLSVRQNDI